MVAVALPAGGPYTSLTLTQNIPGRPTTITAGTSGGATFSIANTVVATGPNDFTNALNWSTNTAPANSDVLVFDAGSTSCLYNLNSSLTGVTVVINPGYGGQIGLARINTSGTTSYAEYRTQSLTMAGGTATINAPQLQRCKLAFGANTTTIRIIATSTQRANQYEPIVQITGGNGSSTLSVTQGDWGIAFYQDQTAQFLTVQSSYANNPSTDSLGFIGVGSTIATITKDGGQLTVQTSATTITQNANGGQGGLLSLQNSGAFTTVTIYGGTFQFGTTGTIGTINLYGTATLNADFDPRGKTITNPINIYSGSVIIVDSQKSINSGTLTTTLNGCAEPTVNHGTNATIVYT